MEVWFEGEGTIGCDLSLVHDAVADHGRLFVEIVSLMPGLSSVELVESSGDAVTIRTNEGLMERTNVTKRTESAQVVIECNERYEAGSAVTTSSHFKDEFTAHESGVTHRLTITDIDTSGLLGFFYKRLGSKKTGNAFLAAYKTYLEGLS